MRNVTKFALLLLTATASVSLWADTLSALDVLDSMRTQDDTVKVTTRIEVYEQGVMQRQSVMDVYVADQRRSLAVYRSEREAGQKVLMIDDKFWLFLPSSKRAMRITAMQKMMGEASVGDVASLDWSTDYRIESQMTDADEIKLDLIAARKGLSYSQVTLWVNAVNFHPLRADFYLKSGKLAKQASFVVSQTENNRWQVSSMALQDRVQKDQTTIIYYDAVEPLTMQDKWFTPNFLLRETP
ncbi:outer membrane lipoprotein-sorting protein [Reinekea sp. G2M2-21]|uniref:outer membrane lipoprotein-sorting protein n=1 Tax=Reinekea sp. G2M2-21 TaxID=2788942 RepID=UPI0018AB14BC|nr:outer membrane lipoprotein-sorting protein [Reinekea sp. G2M2-21]